MTTNIRYKILVVDDEKVIRDFLCRFLEIMPVEVKTAEDGLAAVALVKQEPFDLVFMDIRMPNMNGLEAFAEIKKLQPRLNCIFMTGYAVEEAVLNNIKQPNTICLKKPFESLSQLQELVNKLLEEIKLQKGDIDSRDRRAYVRLDVNLDMEYKIKDASDPFVHSVCKNISLGGIRITAQERLAIGTMLELVIKLPHNNKDYKVNGKVVWVQGVEKGQGPFDTGIMFLKGFFPELSEVILHCSKIVPG